MKIVCVHILLILLLACGRHSGALDRLEGARAVMEEHPDSALAILAQIDTASLASERERALYGLYLTNARYLAYDPSATDSLLTANSAYLSSAPSAYDRMLYHYLSGVMNLDGNRLPSALEHLLEAEKLAEDKCDFLMLGRIDRAIEDIYTKSLNGSQAVIYSKKALDSFRKAGNKTMENWEHLDLAIAFHNAKDYSNCLRLLDSIANFEAEDIYFGEGVKRAKAYSLLEMGEERECISILGGLSTPFTDKDASTLARAYLNLDHLDSASIWISCIDQKQIDYNYASYLLNKRLGNNSASLSSLEATLDNQTDQFRNTINDNLGLVAKRFTEKEAEMEKFKNRMLLVISVALGAVLILLATAWWLHHKRTIRIKELEIERHQKALEEISSKFNDNTQTYQKELVEFGFHDLNGICESFFLNEGKDNIASVIYDKTKEILEKYRTSEEAMEWIEKMADQNHGGAFTLFLKEVNLDNPRLVRIFAYCSLGFSPETIAVLIGTTKKGYYNMKSRLVEEIKASESKNMQLFLEIIGARGFKNGKKFSHE